MTAPSVKLTVLRLKQGLMGLGKQKALVIYQFKFSHSSYLVWLDVYLIRCLLLLRPHSYAYAFHVLLHVSSVFPLSFFPFPPLW